MIGTHPTQLPKWIVDDTARNLHSNPESLMNRRKILFGLAAVCMAPEFVYAQAQPPAGQKRASGQFTTGSTSGGVSLYQDGDHWAVYLETDFDHEGSPDPWVALGQNGFRRDAIIGELVEFKGDQTYPIGPKLNASEFNEVYIWCVEHNVSLGRARLTWR